MKKKIKTKRQALQCMQGSFTDVTEHRPDQVLVVILSLSAVILIIIIIIIIIMRRRRSILRLRPATSSSPLRWKRWASSARRHYSLALWVTEFLTRETCFLFQRISVLLQRFNAVLLHDCLPAL